MSGIARMLPLPLSVLWGATFFLWKVPVENLPPFTAAFGRVGIAALVLILVRAPRGETLPLTCAAWRRFAIMASLNNAIPFALLNNAIPFALLNAIPFALIAYGATAIASGLGSCFAPRPTIRCISAGWQIAGATSSLLVRFLLPITSLLLGGILLDEAIMPEALLGMALIGLGLASIDGRLVARPALRGG